MRDLLKTIPNQLTAMRLVLIPVMWILAWLNLPAYIGGGIFFSFVTDVLDGYIARWLNQTSELGAKFDSIADNLLLPSALFWLWMFRPEIYRDNLLLCAIAIIAYFASLLLGEIKFKRFANLHLYSSKAAAVVDYLFASYALIAAHYNQTFFYLAAILFIISSVEAFLLELYCTEVTDHMGSLVLVWLRREKS
jgi:phosphatidylglycerophosphate synthase